MITTINDEIKFIGQGQRVSYRIDIVIYPNDLFYRVEYLPARGIMRIRKQNTKREGEQRQGKPQGSFILLD